MEILGAIISVVECASPHVAKRWEYHRDFEKNRVALGEVKEKLDSRMKDIVAELDAKLMPDEIEATSEVSSWLERVKKIFREIEDLEKKVGDVKFLSRATLARKMSETKLKVDEIYEEGVFSEGSLIRRLAQRGNVILTPATREGETTFTRTRDEIWRCLFDEKVTKIGIYGMGGVGKTTVVEHINNRLLEQKDKFDKVIWITVANNSSIKTLQDKVARKLEIDLSGVDDDELSRAQVLRKGFVKSRRYVLILDDMWKVEHDTLKKVGIPDPMPVDGCKLILTTRFLDVCHMVGCDKEIVMNLLSDEEALDMFLENVGFDVSSNPKLEEMVKQVARECAHLPLAIVTIARALRRKTDPNEWEVALTDLKCSSVSISSDVMRNLRMSYDWLNDPKLKECLLFCALYPEDHSIERSLLVDQLIAIGVVEDINTRKYQVGKGQVMLNELVSVCLLGDSSTDESDLPSVKMHDLVRDMGIQIMRETSQRFLLKAGEELESIPSEEYWHEDLEKVTLTENKIDEISSSTEPPNCPRITTLFLDLNYFLESIPSNFFSYMKGLTILNLSGTAITSLPESVSDLVNLVMLLLGGCRYLIHVPSLAKLKNMKRLDLNSTRIVEVPKGLEIMVKLTHLDLSLTCLQFIPDGIFYKLINLEFLSLLNQKKVTVLSGDEFSNLRKLETFEACLDLSSLESTLRSFDAENRKHTNMKFLVLPEEVFYDVSVTQNSLLIFHSKIICESPLLLPESINVLRMDYCDFCVSSLSRLFSLDDKTNLVVIVMEYCDGIENLLDFSPGLLHFTQTLVNLDLKFMPDLRRLVCTERAQSPLPAGSFSALTTLVLFSCHRLQNLFVLSNHEELLNLEIIKIEFCDELEEIVSAESDAATISLPKLREIELSGLHKLKSVPFKAESLQRITVGTCPLLDEIRPIDREPYPPSLEYVHMYGHSWYAINGIKWNWNEFNAYTEIERTESEDERYYS